jgi:predicted RNase H-like HicB family nuclease
MKSYTVYIEKDEDGVFIGSVPNVPGCYTQGATLDELMNNLHEVIVLCTRNTQVNLSEFVGVQKIEVAV